MIRSGIATAEILLPREGVDLTRFAVISCDQFTSQPEYWDRVEALVGDAPSALRLTLPEARLDRLETSVDAIHAAMKDYLESGVLTAAVRDGFVLTERDTESGTRTGLIAALDLENYDFRPGSEPLFRATEATVTERLPARERIRDGAAIELPHVMMLVDDPENLLMNAAKKAAGGKLYDFELMEGSGHLRGYAVEGDAAQGVFEAIDALNENCGGMLLAVGDGNHSLAAAKRHWERIRETQPDSPARYALAELVNLYDPALKFEPIHRAVFNCDAEALANAWQEKSGQACEDGSFVIFNRDREWRFDSELREFQPFLDAYMAQHPETRVDYIHDDDALRALVENNEACTGIMPRRFEKEELFDFVRRFGNLPRKTFSMGVAREKRFYLEAKRI